VDRREADSPSWFAAVLGILLGAALLAAALNGGTYAHIPRGETSVLIWWALTLALTLGVLPRARNTKFMTFSVVGWLGLVGWMAISLLWTESVERTVIELTRVLGLLGVVLAIGWGVRGREWVTVAAGVTAAAVAVCGIALMSRLAPDLLTNPLGSTALMRRLAFPLNYWNALGCWAAMTVGLSLAWSAHAPRWPARGAALAGVCVAASVAYLTYSRSAAAGVLIAVVTVVAVSHHRWLAMVHALFAAAGSAAVILAVRGEPAIARGTGGEGGATVAVVIVLVIAVCPLAALATWRARLADLRTPPQRTRAALVATAVTVLLAAVAVGPALAGRAWHSFERPTPSLTGDPAKRFATLGGTRRALWEAAVRGFEAKPLGGTGAGTFEFVWNRDPNRAYFVRDAHSLYLESLSELGVPGAILLVTALGSLLVGAIVAARRESRPMARGAAAGGAAALLVFCVSAGVDWMWESTAVAALALAAGGLAAAAGGRPTLPRGLGRRAPVAAFAALALVVQLPPLGAALQVRASQRAERAQDVDEAVSAATSAVQIAPWSSSGYIQRALLLERLGLGARAAADAQRAIDRESTNWEHWLVLARIEAERGRISAAIAAVRRAAELNPRAPLFASQARSDRSDR
jgi:hypothetical protein